MINKLKKMKKTLLIIALTILAITTVKSQEKIQFGVKGGINFTNMTSNFLYNEDYKTGFHVGALVEIPFGNKFSIQPEILYATYGTKGEVVLTGLNGPISGDYYLDYIQVPLLAKIYVLERISIEIGPSFNFLVNDDEKRGNLSLSDFGDSFEFGGVLGVSYKLKSDFFGSVRYTNGFTDVIEDEYQEAKNYGFLIGIGYLF